MDANVTAHVNAAPDVDGNVPQFTAETFVPGVTAVAITPAGNCSVTVADVPLAAPPLLPNFNVYVIDPSVNTGPVEDFESVNVAG